MPNVRQVAQIEPISRRTDAAEVAQAAYRQLDELLRRLSGDDWAAPTACPGWTVADMVGHLIGAARGNASIREYTRQQLWGLRHRRDFGGNPLDATNALQITDHAGVPDEERADTLARVAPGAVRGRMRLSAVVGPLSVPMSSAGSSAIGMPRTVNLGCLLDVVYTRDVWMHTLDISEATGRPLRLSGVANERIVEDVVAEWVRRHRQPVDLVLTGECGGHYRSGEAEGVLTLDAVEFCRTLSGRSHSEGLMSTKVLF